MRPTEFDEATAIAAGEALLAQGITNITGFALRQHIGGGTPNKLKKMWDNYLTTKHLGEVVATPELPNQVTAALAKITEAQAEQLARLAKEINAIAIKAADRRVEELLKQQEAEAKQHEAELAEITEAFIELENTLKKETEKTKELEKQLSQAIQERNEARKEARKVRETAANLTGQLEAITDQNKQLLATLKPKK